MIPTLRHFSDAGLVRRGIGGTGSIASLQPVNSGHRLASKVYNVSIWTGLPTIDVVLVLKV